MNELDTSSGRSITCCLLFSSKSFAAVATSDSVTYDAVGSYDPASSVTGNSYNVVVVVVVVLCLILL